MTTKQHTTPTPKSSTMGRRLAGFSGSPILFLCLGGTTVALAVKLVLLYAVMAAPPIQGWNWGDHPNTLLIAYRASTCGCGAHLSEAIAQGAQHRADVLVVASAADAADASLAPVRADRRVQVLSGISPQTLRLLLPKGGTAILNIQRGRIRHQVTGSILPDDFFN